jgi:hypothetical protein
VRVRGHLPCVLVASRNRIAKGWQMKIDPELIEVWKGLESRPEEWAKELCRKLSAVLIRQQEAIEKAGRGYCDACGYPKNEDGTCSRRQCYNSD